MKKMKQLAGLLFCALFAYLSVPANVLASEGTEQTRSLAETLEYALLNTVMGISIVFIVLLLISRIIALFKYINKFEQKHAAKNTPAAAPAPTAEEPEEEEEELSDDLELVAVITAAIHAYEEAQGNDIPADGLVVRSIRKANKTRWQNA